MMRIASFKGRYPAPEGIRRYVLRVDDLPSLMIEFFPSDYHVYGAKAQSVSEILGTINELHDALGVPSDGWEFECQLVGRTGKQAYTKKRSFRGLEAALYSASDLQYFAVKSPPGLLWSDILPAKNPRSGFATKYRIYEGNLGFIRNFSSVPIKENDLPILVDFLKDETYNRYAPWKP